MKLIIVESPHKAATFQKYLGKGEYTVVSSKGHIRDLQEHDLGIDIANGFTPEYVVPADKKRTVSELKALVAKADEVYLASDEDREGEAISWHLSETLNLDPAKTHRITFHEITKPAILHALDNPRTVDMNLVDAQQARRVLDRLVGYELSPVLWRKIRRGLSAGRVQSATLRLVTDKEKEIMAFENKLYYKVEADFIFGRSKVKGNLNTRFEDAASARQFLQDCIGATYTVESVEKKDATRMPAAPFTTSTLQQEVGRKLRMSVSQTMRTAQALYEKGLITYMRTDSTNLSSLAINASKDYIVSTYGESYSRPRQYKTHSKGAQEAHEAIRPTYIATTEIEGTSFEQRLYNLIWKRTVASQMAEAKLLNTNVEVGVDKRSERYVLQSSEVVFDGFLKLYLEGRDEEDSEEGLTILPPMNIGDVLNVKKVNAICKYTQAPGRYTEPMLVKKMEEIGIGRPSTYAATITTLTKERGYLIKGDKEGEKRSVLNFTLENGVVKESEKVETINAEKGKLLPTEMGMAVSNYLVDNFADILNYQFTANVENDFDKIASGELEWRKCIGNFYTPFHQEVDKAVADKQFHRVERIIGVDPADGKTIIAKLGQYGPYVQKGEEGDKVYAKLGEGQLIENITLADALKLFSLPRTLGQLEGTDIVVKKGRFGAYLQYGERNISLPKGADPLKFTLTEAEDLIKATPAKSAIAQWGNISVLNGPYGAYIKADGKNYRIPKGVKAETLTEEQCKEIIANQPATNGKRKK